MSISASYTKVPWDRSDSSSFQKDDSSQKPDEATTGDGQSYAFLQYTGGRAKPKIPWDRSASSSFHNDDASQKPDDATGERTVSSGDEAASSSGDELNGEVLIMTSSSSAPSSKNKDVRDDALEDTENNPASEDAESRGDTDSISLEFTYTASKSVMSTASSKRSGIAETESTARVDRASIKDMSNPDATGNPGEKKDLPPLPPGKIPRSSSFSSAGHRLTSKLRKSVPGFLTRSRSNPDPADHQHESTPASPSMVSDISKDESVLSSSSSVRSHKNSAEGIASLLCSRKNSNEGIASSVCSHANSAEVIIVETVHTSSTQHDPGSKVASEGDAGLPDDPLTEIASVSSQVEDDTAGSTVKDDDSEASEVKEDTVASAAKDATKCEGDEPGDETIANTAKDTSSPVSDVRDVIVSDEVKESTATIWESDVIDATDGANSTWSNAEESSALGVAKDVSSDDEPVSKTVAGPAAASEAVFDEIQDPWPNPWSDTTVEDLFGSAPKGAFNPLWVLPSKIPASRNDDVVQVIASTTGDKASNVASTHSKSAHVCAAEDNTPSFPPADAASRNGESSQHGAVEVEVAQSKGENLTCVVGDDYAPFHPNNDGPAYDDEFAMGAFLNTMSTQSKETQPFFEEDASAAILSNEDSRHDDNFIVREFLKTLSSQSKEKFKMGTEDASAPRHRDYVVRELLRSMSTQSLEALKLAAKDASANRHNGLAVRGLLETLSPPPKETSKVTDEAKETSKVTGDDVSAPVQQRDVVGDPAGNGASENGQSEQISPPDIPNGSVEKSKSVGSFSCISENIEATDVNDWKELLSTSTKTVCSSTTKPETKMKEGPQAKKGRPSPSFWKRTRHILKGKSEQVSQKRPSPKKRAGGGGTKAPKGRKFKLGYLCIFSPCTKLSTIKEVDEATAEELKNKVDKHGKQASPILPSETEPVSPEELMDGHSVSQDELMEILDHNDSQDGLTYDKPTDTDPAAQTLSLSGQTDRDEAKDDMTQQDTVNSKPQSRSWLTEGMSMESMGRDAPSKTLTEMSSFGDLSKVDSEPGVTNTMMNSINLYFSAATKVMQHNLYDVPVREFEKLRELTCHPCGMPIDEQASLVDREIAASDSHDSITVPVKINVLKTTTSSSNPFSMVFGELVDVLECGPRPCGPRRDTTRVPKKKTPEEEKVEMMASANRKAKSDLLYY